MNAVVAYYVVRNGSSKKFIQSKPEPIMLLILPIILSRILNSHIFHPLFLFYSHTITY